MKRKDTFGERLNKLLYENNMSQRELNNHIGVGLCSISRYVCGKQIPTVRVLVAISETFNVSSDWLLGLSEERERK